MHATNDHAQFRASMTLYRELALPLNGSMLAVGAYLFPCIPVPDGCGASPDPEALADALLATVKYVASTVGLLKSAPILVTLKPVRRVAL